MKIILHFLLKKTHKKLKRNLIKFILNLDVLRTFNECQKVECALLCKNIGESFVFKKCVALPLMKDKFYLN